ncbi:DNA transposase THAP9 [Chionoecetes opilio]|uniref:DNA transposase THAP9 n=1 Tax=Chionoecetes opilio TaxID=41210 RepID=A0A8J4YRI9_CHIOP|nr:DNA transposase THAP9 [Chionoecetes opilio]
MEHCAAYGCKNGHRNTSRKIGITFHRFPNMQKDKTRNREWIRNTRWNNWTPSKRSVLCSDHFSASSFDRTGQTVRLRSSAAPTIFTLPSHLCKEQKERKSSIRSVLVEDLGNDLTVDCDVTPSSAPPVTSSDSSSSSFSTLSDSSISTTSVAPDPSSATNSLLPDHSSPTTSKPKDPSTVGTPPDSTTSLSTPIFSRKHKHFHVSTDHTYAMKQSPKERKLNFLHDHLVVCKKKSKTQNQRVKRMKKKVEDLHAVVTTLQQKDLVSGSCASLLNKIVDDVPKAVVQRMLETMPKQRGTQYSEELKAFAMTLQFYSNKAYEYVRKMFSFSLPHPRTLRSWYSKVDGEPGFTQSAFTTLKKLTEDNQHNNKATICSLVMDEMSIRKHLDIINGMSCGYVNIGNGIIEDAEDDTLASQALVVMAVAVNASWKLPLGYANIVKEPRANIVKETLHRLHGVGVQVIAVTCDGPSCNWAMIKELGAVLTVSHTNTSFPYPSDPNKNVFIILDVCHMLKLIRNTLGTLQMRDKEGRNILWHYIENLHKLQNSEGLLLANKLRSAHVQWQKQKMKVNLAAQLLSSCVADAIEYCNNDLHLQNFKDSEGTVEFLRIFDKLFDTLNSRNPLGKGFKAPMRLSNSREMAGNLQGS